MDGIKRPDIQFEVECELIRGLRVTVGTIYQTYHTHDGRRIISRLQKRFNNIGQHIHAEKLTHDGATDSFKTYWLIKSPQEKLSI